MVNPQTMEAAVESITSVLNDHYPNADFDIEKTEAAAKVTVNTSLDIESSAIDAINDQFEETAAEEVYFNITEVPEGYAFYVLYDFS